MPAYFSTYVSDKRELLKVLTVWAAINCEGSKSTYVYFCDGSSKNLSSLKQESNATEFDAFNVFLHKISGHQFSLSDNMPIEPSIGQRSLDKNRDNDDRQEHGSSRNEDQRKVIITGTSEAQWKAQFYIMEKIKTETMIQKMDDVFLQIEILVPKGAIGRIIWKGGKHVKEMQRVTGVTVKTPDTQSVPDNEDVPVSILGDFYASQSAQHRIRALLNQSIKGPSEDRPRPIGRPAVNGS